MSTADIQSKFARQDLTRSYRTLGGFLFVLFVMLALFVITATTGHASQVTLAWDASSDPGLAGYKLYYGTQSQNYSHYIDVGNQADFTVTDLPGAATYYFAATAYDGAGQESGFSNETNFTAPPDCTYSISPANQPFAAEGGTGTVSVTTQDGCSWSASGGTWITVTSGGNGTGGGSVSYVVSANATASTRTMATSVAGQIFTVTQAGSTTYSVTASAGTGGSISPSGSVNVTSGASKSFSVTPNTGYRISDVRVDGVSVGAVGSYTFMGVAASHTIAATFTVSSTYTLTVTKTGTGSGSITSSPSGSTYASGTAVTLTATPAAGSTFGGWSGACTGTSLTCRLTMNSNVTVTASFATAAPTTLYTITANAGAGGTISPAGSISVASGTSKTFTITPASGYRVNTVTVDGRRLGGRSSYTFSNVRANHSIAVKFSRRW